MRWNETYHGTVVNLYLIRKMFKSENPIDYIDEIMHGAFLSDLKYRTREVKHMTYVEYLNFKRQELASIMGLPQYF